MLLLQFIILVSNIISVSNIKRYSCLYYFFRLSRMVVSYALHMATIRSEPYDFPRLKKLVTKLEQGQAVSRVVSSGVGLGLMAFITLLAD